LTTPTLLPALLALAVAVGVLMVINRGTSSKETHLESRMHQIARMDGAGKEGEAYEEYEETHAAQPVSPTR
jgi:hypothetical protein